MQHGSRVGSAYPETDSPTNTRPFSPDVGQARPAKSGTGQSCRRGVWVPRRVRDSDISDLAVAVYAILLAWSPSSGGPVIVGRDRIMTALGRDGRAPDAADRAVRELVDAGVVMCWRRHQRHLLRYELLARPGRDERWDVVPRELLEAIQDGRLGPHTLRAWLHVDQAVGAKGWTADPVERLAQSLTLPGQTPVSPATARRRLADFVDAGLLEVRRAGSGRIHALPGRASQVEPVSNQLKSHVAPADDVDGAVDEVMNAGSALMDAGSLVRDLSPEDLTTTTPSSELCSDRSVSDVGTTATGGLRPKRGEWSDRGAVMGLPTGGVFADPHVRWVLQAAGPWWSTGPARQWVGGVATRVRDALAGGMSAAAAAQALVDLAVTVMDEAGGRHVPAAEKALRVRAAEIRHGLACRECGRGHEPRDGVWIRSGLCGVCAEAAGVVADLPSLEALRQVLGGRAGQGRGDALAQSWAGAVPAELGHSQTDLAEADSETIGAGEAVKLDHDVLEEPVQHWMRIAAAGQPVGRMVEGLCQPPTHSRGPVCRGRGAGGPGLAGGRERLGRIFGNHLAERDAQAADGGGGAKPPQPRSPADAGRDDQVTSGREDGDDRSLFPSRFHFGLVPAGPDAQEVSP